MRELNELIVKLFLVMTILTAYKGLYLVLGLLVKKKIYPITDIKKRYAIIIPARNEAEVIENLIESIHRQTYDQEYIDIFVVADNCTDETAEIARDAGCHVYERFEPEKARKGWALEFLFKQIEKDYGIMSFDGYVFFDADNLLKENYLEELNKAFVVNGNVVNTYRNTKNIDTNFISAAYGLHYYSDTVRNHRPRTFLNIGTHVAGTGFVVANHLLKDGWKYFRLVEDTEFSMVQVINNVKIGFCEDAIFYDEQPTKITVSWRQRVRWANGHLSVFVKYWPKLFLSVFTKRTFYQYDALYYLLPWGLIKGIIQIIYALLTVYYAIYVTDSFSLRSVIIGLGGFYGGMYISTLFRNTVVMIREHKQINCSLWKSILYLLLSPWYSITNLPIAIQALFTPNVVWKPTKHEDKRKISDLAK